MLITLLQTHIQPLSCWLRNPRACADHPQILLPAHHSSSSAAASPHKPFPGFPILPHRR